MFDWENAIALDTMQGNRGSFRREGNVSWVFSSCGRNLGYILELQWVLSIGNSSLFIEVRNLSRYEGQLRNVNKAWQENTEASGS